ncbi:unnamed protein product [Tenebrio molitor]|nr:unnamed protein product [Tenebrio molitor]
MSSIFFSLGSSKKFAILLGRPPKVLMPTGCTYIFPFYNL